MRVIGSEWLFGMAVVFAELYFVVGLIASILGDFDSIGERIVIAGSGPVVGGTILLGLLLYRSRPTLGGTLLAVGVIVGGYVGSFGLAGIKEYVG